MSYNAAEALLTTKRVEIIEKKEFANPALDENVEAFVVHVTSLSLDLMPIHQTWKAQFDANTPSPRGSDSFVGYQRDADFGVGWARWSLRSAHNIS